MGMPVHAYLFWGIAFSTTHLKELSADWNSEAKTLSPLESLESLAWNMDQDTGVEVLSYNRQDNLLGNAVAGKPS